MTKIEKLFDFIEQNHLQIDLYSIKDDVIIDNWLFTFGKNKSNNKFYFFPSGSISCIKMHGESTSNLLVPGKVKIFAFNKLKEKALIFLNEINNKSSIKNIDILIKNYYGL